MEKLKFIEELTDAQRADINVFLETVEQDKKVAYEETASAKAEMLKLQQELVAAQSSLAKEQSINRLMKTINDANILHTVETKTEAPKTAEDNLKDLSDLEF